MSPPTPSSSAAPEVEALRAELVAVERRLVKIETVLMSVFGPHVLGGGPPIAREPAPQRPAPAQKLVAPGPNGFF
jgi:hypothetical protein